MIFPFNGHDIHGEYSTIHASDRVDATVLKLLEHVRKEKLRTVYEEILTVLAQGRAEWQ